MNTINTMYNNEPIKTINDLIDVTKSIEQVKRGKGRPKLNKTIEEKKLAQQIISKRYYETHREQQMQKVKDWQNTLKKFAEVKPIGRPKSNITDEEKKAKYREYQNKYRREKNAKLRELRDAVIVA